MLVTDGIESDHARGVSAVVTVAVASWFTLVFAVALGGLFLGA